MSRQYMTDSEWAIFRSRHLSLNNIYLPDCDRPLYDASVDEPEPRRGEEGRGTAPAAPALPSEGLREAPGPPTAASRGMGARSQPDDSEIDLSEFT